MTSPVSLSKQPSNQGSQPSSNSPPLTRIQSISFGTLPSRIDTESPNASAASEGIIAENGDEPTRGRLRSRSPQISPPMSIRTDMSTSVTDVDSVFDLAASSKPARYPGAQRKPAVPYPRSPFPWQLRGYPKLATAMAQEPSLAVFRRFGRLNALNLLALQAELAQLEAEYEETLREEDSSADPALCALSSDMTATLQQGQERTTRQYELLLAMRPKLEAYNAALAATASVDNLAKPAQGSVDSLRAWLAAPECGNDFLERNETSDAEAMTYDSAFDNDLVSFGRGGSHSNTSQPSGLINPNLLSWLHKHVTAILEPIVHPLSSTVSSSSSSSSSSICNTSATSPTQPKTSLTGDNTINTLLNMNEKASTSVNPSSDTCYFTSNSSTSSLPHPSSSTNLSSANLRSSTSASTPQSWHTQRASLHLQTERLNAWSQLYSILLVLAASLLPVLVATLMLTTMSGADAGASKYGASAVLATATAGFGLFAATATTLSLRQLFVATTGFVVTSTVLAVGGALGLA